MQQLSQRFIQQHIADSPAIYKRGISLFEQGAYALQKWDNTNNCYVFSIDGNYGDYTVDVELKKDSVAATCDCPYPAPDANTSWPPC